MHKSDKQKQTDKKSYILLSILIFVILVFISAVILIMKRLANKELENNKVCIRDNEMMILSLKNRLKDSDDKIKEKEEIIKANEKEFLKIREAQNEKSNTVECIEDFCRKPICQDIIIKASAIEIKSYSKVDVDMTLTSIQISQLLIQVDKSFNGFTRRLKIHHPELKKSDVDYCCLCLLNLDNKRIGALLGYQYQSALKRSKKLKSIFKTDEEICEYLKTII